MKNTKSKILSLLLAMVMILGSLAPVVSRAAVADGKTDSVTLHKILMDKDTFAKFPEGTEGIDKTKYTGNKIANVKDYFAGTNNQTAKVEDAGGIYFAWQKEFTINDGKNPEYKVWKYIDANGKAIGTDITVDGKVVGTNIIGDNGQVIPNVLGGKTVENQGFKFATSGLNKEEGQGEKKQVVPTQYRIVEVQELSTYTGENGEVLTGSKAVPVEITLPLYNNDGLVVDAHVYPKNTEEGPKIDKNFAKANSLKGDDLKNIPGGADYAKYLENKAAANAQIGQEVPYEVKTLVPQNSKFKTARWTDTMTPGLTYQKDLVVKYFVGETAPDSDAEQGWTVLQEANYTKVETDSGFELELNETGLEFVEKEAKKGDVHILLTYKAKTNGDMIVDNPEKNNIDFTFGNNKIEKPKPVPVKPGDGKIIVDKSWSDNKVPTDVTVTYFLWEVDQTNGNKVVASVAIKNGAVVKSNLTGDIKYEQDATNKYKVTFSGLDDAKSYQVTEIARGYTPEYTGKDGVTGQAGQAGQIGITNKKQPNGGNLVPETPEVKNGGKKFVKTDQTGNERLAGAEFYIRDGKDDNAKYLSLKSGDQTAQEVTAYETAEGLYTKAIADFNAEAAKEDYNNETVVITVDSETITGETAIKEKIAKLKADRDAKFAKARENYTWVDSSQNALVLTSDDQGRFEITGLAYGTYYLEEKTPPAGYAKRSDKPEFKIDGTSYTIGTVDIKYNPEDTTDGAKQVINKKVTIPQTGGIGTAIFFVVGAALMGGAIFTMKRREAVEEA